MSSTIIIYSLPIWQKEDPNSVLWFHSLILFMKMREVKTTVPSYTQKQLAREVGLIHQWKKNEWNEYE